MKKSVSYVNNRIRIFENKNEIILSYSCATDLTNLRKANDSRNNLKRLEEECFYKFGFKPTKESSKKVVDYLESNLNDKEISFKREDGSINWQGLQDYKDNTSIYHKADSSIYRAKNVIYDLMQSNYWDFFVTITINPNSEFWKNTDIKNVREVQYKITDRIRNINKRSKRKIEYVLIPEYQENGNVHFHGVIRGINKEDLEIAINNQEWLKDDNGEIQIDIFGNKIPNKYYKQPLIRKGNQVYNYKKFSDIGYNDFEIIRDMSRVGSYCTKYITKDLFDRANEYGSHLYICSQGLERKKEVYTREIDNFHYLTEEDIKKNLHENAYIVRSKYATKVIINKRDLRDIEVVKKYVNNIPGKTIHKDIDESSSIWKFQKVLQKLNKSDLSRIGVQHYDDVTGEIEFIKDKAVVMHKVMNPETYVIEKKYEKNKSFRQLKIEKHFSMFTDSIQLKL